MPLLLLQQTFTGQVAAAERLKAVHCVALAKLDEILASLQLKG